MMLSDEEVKARADRIRLLIFDVDGVLTDGRLFFAPDGSELKVFNTLDGHGIKMLQRSGIEVAIISGRKSSQVEKRAADLGIRHLVQGREDKLVALQEMLKQVPMPLDLVAFMGDDLPDLAVMRRVGLALTVPNAHPEVKKHAHWQSQAKGGEGAAREACDLLMLYQNTLAPAVAEYL